jgi:hypothetical protein
MYIDGSVYPDADTPPEELLSVEAKADYVHRIVSAWDFGITPEPETFALFSQWKEVFDAFPIETSLAYHAMREWFGWEPVPLPPGIYLPEPRYRELDRIEGRTDPCEHMI